MRSSAPRCAVSASAGSIISAAGAKVIATLQGAYGSSRSESSAWMYYLNGESRDELWRDRESYLRNVEGGSLWYGHRQARVTTAGTFTPFTLDNRIAAAVHEPARPRRGCAVRAGGVAVPSRFAVVELPVAIGHLQEGARKRSELTRSAPPPRFNYFVADFVQRQLNEFLAEDPEQRLGLLANNLRDIAGASETRRLRVLREYLAYVRADAIERLQQQFESVPNAPIYWQADVRSIIEANGRALTAKAPPRLGGWPERSRRSRLRAHAARRSHAPRRRRTQRGPPCGSTRASRANVCSARSERSACRGRRGGLTSVVIVAADSGPLLLRCVDRRARIECARSRSSSSTTRRPMGARRSRRRCIASDARFRLIANADNLGFGPACNQGAAHRERRCAAVSQSRLPDRARHDRRVARDRGRGSIDRRARHRRAYARRHSPRAATVGAIRRCGARSWR